MAGLLLALLGAGTLLASGQEDPHISQISPSSVSAEYLSRDALHSTAAVLLPGPAHASAPAPPGRSARSAAPPSSHTHEYDALAASDNFEDALESNEVEVRPRAHHWDVRPTRVQLDPALAIAPTGEARGAPRARALQGPRAPPTTATSPRQANPDIQDIITGIVKLLNGNVNVQADTGPPGARPPRPPASRINNRGPPRISDVPPLPPDFDTPGPAPPGMLPPPPQSATRHPPPYPFDRPPARDKPPNRPFLDGVPLPEQIVPLPGQDYRPGFAGGRPELPPWQRPRPRPPNPHRRPNPNLPMYRPQAQPRPQPQTTPAVEDPPAASEPLAEEDAAPPATSPSVIPDAGESFVKTRDPPPQPPSSPSLSLSPSIVLTEALPPEEPRPDGDEETATSTVTTPAGEEPTKREILKEGDGDKKKQTMIKLEKEKPAIKKQDEKTKDSEATISNGESEGPHVSSEETRGTPALEGSVSAAPANATPVVATPLLPASSSPASSSPASSGVSAGPVESGREPIHASGSASSAASITPTLITTGVAADVSADVTSDVTAEPTKAESFPYRPYRGRPGIVLDDNSYRPAGGRPPPRPRPGEIFDVTVSAVQGGEPGQAATVHIESVNPLTGQPGDIIVSAAGEQGFVSIDGMRTYLNLFGGATEPPRPSASAPAVRPTARPTAAVTGTGYAVPAAEGSAAPPHPATVPRPARPPARRPQPPVRIDTCIVGDDSTCDQTQNEKCKTETGISSCQCRAGYARRLLRAPCRRVVAMVLSLRVDRMYDRKVAWDGALADKDSDLYQQLSYEAVRAVDSAFSMTPYSDEFVSGSVNSIYRGDSPKPGPGVYVNITVLLEESGETLGTKAGSDITRHLLGVIQRRGNNVGASALWVDRPASSVSDTEDLDECSSPELNDCHELATCTNIWGSFKCECPEAARDAWVEQPHRAGRNCLTCPASHCSHRGSCSYRRGQPVCMCTGAYYGSQCEVDGEVVGVAVGASLAALVVIILTLACLVMWSRRWSREQKGAGLGSPVFGYMAGAAVKPPNMGHPPYQVTLEERMRWAQLADVMAQANHYAPEPLPNHPGARPASAMYGAYPTLPHSGTLPPVPMPRLGLHMGASTLHLNAQTGNMNGTLASRNTLGPVYPHSGHQNHAESTSSESDSHAQDRADLLGSRGFHVPRPKSRSNATNSIANQSGIYYDVDYENAPDPIYGSKGIPLSTYTMSRAPQFYRQ